MQIRAHNEPCKFETQKREIVTASLPTPETIFEQAFELFVGAIHQPKDWGINVVDVGDSKVLDFAVDREGTVEAGILLSQICFGGLGEVTIKNADDELGLKRVRVRQVRPLLPCMGSQYAGWPVAHEKFFAMGSGPMRMLRGQEDVLAKYGLAGVDDHAVGVLESNKLPTESVIQQVATECGVKTRNVCLCVARTASYPGSIQVVARSVETALHKLHELGFDLKTIVDSTGLAPIPPIADDDMTALGWTNDSMLYGAKVELKVDTSDAAIKKIADQIPSCSSVEFGKPFLEIFNKYEKDFYKIDKMLFSPAEIEITNTATGSVFHAGEIRNDIIRQSFGL